MPRVTAERDYQTAAETFRSARQTRSNLDQYDDNGNRYRYNNNGGNSTGRFIDDDERDKSVGPRRSSIVAAAIVDCDRGNRGSAPARERADGGRPAGRAGGRAGARWRVRRSVAQTSIIPEPRALDKLREKRRRRRRRQWHRIRRLTWTADVAVCRSRHDRPVAHDTPATHSPRRSRSRV